MADKKILYNIKKAQLSKITEMSTAGLPTYGEPIPVPGSVSLSLDNDSSSDIIYADGVAYYTPTGSNSYSGTLENVHFSNKVLQDIFNWVLDTNNNLVEVDSGSNEFGMQFAVDSDDGEVYFTMYRCTATKPSQNFQTKEASATVNNESVSITIMPITLADGKNVIKSFAEKGATNYATYMTKIVVPTIGDSI